MDINKDCIDKLFKYILSIFLGNNYKDFENMFAYVKDENSTNCKYVIIRSNFFDDDIYMTEKSMPILPLKNIDGVPLLFGLPKIKKKNDRIIFYSDFIASSFFLISRYEEIVNTNNVDKFGRFKGTGSLPYLCNFINRPIVDEYGVLIKKYLNISDKRKIHNKVILTHDVDVPYIKNNFVCSVLKSIKYLLKLQKHFFWPITNFFGNPFYDKICSFKEIVIKDNMLDDAEKIYFIKSGGHHYPEDAEIYINDRSFKTLLSYLVKNNACIGYHASFDAGLNPKKFIGKEINKLKETINSEIHKSRNHYLLSIKPTDFIELIKNNILDDYTMGYADIAGFRLGTCKKIKWINPCTLEITNLNLHPLLMMDGSFFGESYMNLSLEQAKKYSQMLIDKCFEIDDSEICLLWHNNDISNIVWDLYDFVIEYIKNKETANKL